MLQWLLWRNSLSTLWWRHTRIFLKRWTKAMCDRSPNTITHTSGLATYSSATCTIHAWAKNLSLEAIRYFKGRKKERSSGGQSSELIFWHITRWDFAAIELTVSVLSFFINPEYYGVYFLWSVIANDDLRNRAAIIHE